ncbi:hypothetical protein AYO21_00716 [Fonsecaea monophora]|uniref:Uncharacterized protein n=2 Tax=Fonsecaea TaxID=40354 RepID=A0A0D2FHQ3_9EURO|nr:uncharacterized protein Z517_01617 [Fonsecaea pedrosoi CBS 271.37]XP_022516709.1 hypothetical protein AYO21_00716 [Fonsecaea monophora]KAH0848505.1 hypothetical protein FOPE_02643 [Fonsecaea pedrosoi]KIW86222.1 hypothetical protein Z517_01617 [Fonsecaea pedrosoi CBS 271.37]OAG44757.1 hypothetical protein AYO21_00716 [Fonsecaea monophora]
MPLPRSAALRGTLRSFSFRRAGTQARTSFRQVGRRTYATEHGASKGSDIPWLIGSLVVTIPAAAWLWQQGPQISDHGHESHSTEKHEEAPPEEPKEEEPSEEEPPKEDSASTEEGGKEEETQDEAKEESSDESGDKEPTPKGTALPEDQSKESEEKGAKDAQGDVSGANNPFMGDEERSKKPEGMEATAKIHGTVDTSQRSSKGHHESGQKDD